MKAPRFVQLPTLFALAALALVNAPRPAQAVPYACNLTNAGTFIAFRLNESADSVKIVFNGGATTNDLGALPSGLHTPALSIAGNFQVVVSKASGLGYRTAIAPGRAAVLQISTDNTTLRFNQPRGLAINNDPASPNFGLVYVSNSGATNSPRNVGDGIYVLSSDLADVLGQGDTALTAGLDFSASASASPYRLNVGQDGNLYIADWADASGSLYVTDPILTSGSGQNILGGLVGGPFPVTSSRNHGSIAAAVVLGSLGTGDLRAYVVDEDLQDNPDAATGSQRQSLWRHDIGSALPGPFQPATRIALHPNTFLRTVGNQTMDLARSPSGNFFVSNYRSSGTEANIWALDPAGMLIWSSLAESRVVLGNTTAADLLRATGGIDVSPNGDVLAAINIETNGITVMSLLGNGLPDLTNRLALNGFNTVAGQGREVAFDRAGNLYAVSSGAGMLRVFSPGGTTTAITGSDGTFQLIRPPAVTVATTTNIAYEAGPVSGSFSINRSGDLSSAVTVLYTLTGTATNGSDYTTDPLSATIPVGATNVEVHITPISDGQAEFTEQVIITLVGSGNYDLGTPATASLDIVDDQQPNVIDISVIDSNAIERLGGTDGLRYVWTRRGDTNLELFVAITTTDGTATPSFDFQDLPSAVVFAPGVVTVTNEILIVDDGNVEGNETVVVKVVPGVDPYLPGMPDSAAGVILDDEEPAACVLFSDNFDTDSSALWTERFGATNGILDRTLFWNYDYSQLGIPPAPRSVGGTTRGLYVTVNKDSLFSAAGVNLYPNGQSFRGNYALRFDLYLNIGNSNQTEHALAGLNHSGSQTNWVSQNPANHANSRGNDGVFVAINAAGGNLGDYAAYTATNTAAVPGQLTNRAASTLASVFPVPPFAFAGSIGCASNAATKVWSQVELRQLNGRVNLLINNYPVLDLINSTPYTSGNVMIGYNDQFSSRGSELNFAIFDNVRVVQLDFQIKSIELLPGNQVQIDFVSPVLIPKLSDLRLFSAPDLNSPASFVLDAGAVFSAIPEGWRAVTTRNGANRFYQVRIQQ